MKEKKNKEIDQIGLAIRNPARVSGGGAVVQVPKKWLGYVIEAKVIAKQN